MVTAAPRSHWRHFDKKAGVAAIPRHGLESEMPCATESMCEFSVQGTLRSSLPSSDRELPSSGRISGDFVDTSSTVLGVSHIPPLTSDPDATSVPRRRVSSPRINAPIPTPPGDSVQQANPYCGSRSQRPTHLPLTPSHQLSTVYDRQVSSETDSLCLPTRQASPPSHVTDIGFRVSSPVGADVEASKMALEAALAPYITES